MKDFILNIKQAVTREEIINDAKKLNYTFIENECYIELTLKNKLILIDKEELDYGCYNKENFISISININDHVLITKILVLLGGI